MVWEVSMIMLKDGDVVKYKVTRRFSEYYIAETKIFDDKDDALRQFNEWLS
ncbi:MAG: hypothetical protein ACP5OA_05090 [Candidatus Woesearchaeota archaeon]